MWLTQKTSTPKKQAKVSPFKSLTGVHPHLQQQKSQLESQTFNKYIKDFNCIQVF